MAIKSVAVVFVIDDQQTSMDEVTEHLAQVEHIGWGHSKPFLLPDTGDEDISGTDELAEAQAKRLRRGLRTLK